MFLTFAVYNAVLCVTTKCLRQVASSKKGTHLALLWMQDICCSCCAATVFASSKKKKSDVYFFQREGVKKKSDVRLTARYSAFIVVYHLHVAPLFI